MLRYHLIFLGFLISQNVFADTSVTQSDDYSNENIFLRTYHKTADAIRHNFGTTEEEKLALIKRIQTYSTKGDYDNARASLAVYKYLLGEDDIYLTEKARILALTNQSTASLAIINELLKKDPKNSTYQDLKKYALAHPDTKPIHLTSENLQKNTNDATAILESTRQQLLQGHYKNAQVLLERYKKTYGEDDKYNKEKARYLAFTGDQNSATILLKSLLDKYPSDQELLAIKTYIVNHPPTPTDPAALAVQKGDYSKAIRIYKKELAKNPDDKSNNIHLITALLLSGQYKPANNALSHYKTRFGEDSAYLTEEARYNALTGKRAEAIKIIDTLLRNDPNNATLLSIKKFALTSPSIVSQPSSLDIAKALEQKAISVNTNADLYADAAKAYMDAGDPKQALVMIEGALNIHPKHLSYLLAKAEYYAAVGDKQRAYNLYKSLYTALPNDLSIVLGLARAAGNIGKLDESADLYAYYNQQLPYDQAPWLERAYIQSFRGNSRKAINVLDRYYELFGSNQEYLVVRSRIVASAVRPTPALAIINNLLPVIPENYSLNYANTVALYYNNQPIEMFNSLAKVQQLKPTSPETLGLTDFIRTPFRSNINVDAFSSFDSDTVKIDTLTLSGQYFISPITTILPKFTAERLSASQTSGLNPIDGGFGLELYEYSIGASERFDRHLKLQGSIGGANSTVDENAFIYDLQAFITTSELLNINFLFQRDFYDVSARAVSLGVKQNLNQVSLLLQPCIQCYVNATASYSTFTDSNTMKLGAVNPAIQVIANERMNVLLGASGLWYAFSEDFNHGYYDPDWYRYYAITANAYIKQSDNIGYQFSLGIGTQKDNTFITYKPANDLSLKGYFGIYKDWYLVLTAAGSSRGRAIGNNPTLDTYRVYAFDATITRRF